ncbi:hypothetical protein COY27_04205 [Candidatus Woesearchaeota archaeon CG_4_10_14_0_2_um_filter_33_13]|nr:MAG: hypothetical protein COY27_04205 [Candidatus Woesearchaeota archaeon CG_4_10_14_0_2_um_filter_33_13]
MWLRDIMDRESGAMVSYNPQERFSFDARPSDRSISRRFSSSGLYVNGIRIKKEQVSDLLNSAENNDLRGAARYLNSLVQQNIGGPEDVPSLVKLLDRVVRKNVDKLSSDAQSRFLSFMTLARYEAEVIAGSYQGAFIPPEDLITLLPAKGTYLSVATGPGDDIRKMKSLLPEATFIGVDISEEMVARALKEDPNGIYGMADAQQLPFKYSLFDGVVMLNALDRIPNPRKALYEVSRVLKAGGTFIVGNCNPLQYEKEVSGGVTLTYVPLENRISSMEEALQVAGCKVLDTRFDLPWNIETIADGKEPLLVDLAVGRRY